MSTIYRNIEIRYISIIQAGRKALATGNLALPIDSILTIGPIIYTEHKITPIDESEPLF